MHKYYWAFAILFIIYLIGFGIDVMDIDAAQYASMSREMLQTGNYLQLYDVGKEYLDKPPFLMWISAASMKIFGINNFAYRLPSFLFSILAIVSTYKFCRLFYSEKISLLSALILATSQAFFLMNHDVRTDTILMSWVIFTIWQLAAFFKTNSFPHFILACVGIAGGLMTKGPIALIVPVFAFGSHFLLQRNFRAFFKWQYLAGIIIVSILILPMCIGLYQQYDLQPGKIVNGKTGVSGLRFFFWTQSFGRITGESDWNNNSNIFFLLQNMLWSFLPWIFFFLIAFFIQIKYIVRQGFKISLKQEAITTGGFMLTYLSLGLSKYQLPHYIFVVFPLAAIITARFLQSLTEENKYRKLYPTLLYMHLVLFTLMWMALMVLLYFVFDNIPGFVTLLAGVLLAVFIYIFITQKNRRSILITMCLFTIIGLNIFLNASFYPSLLKYQMGNTAGRWIAKQKIPTNNIRIYKFDALRSLHFYAKGNIYRQDSIPAIKPGDWIITGKENLAELDQYGLKYDTFFRGKDFHVSRLSLKFLNPERREKELTPYVIIKIK